MFIQSFSKSFYIFILNFDLLYQTPYNYINKSKCVFILKNKNNEIFSELKNKLLINLIFCFFLHKIYNFKEKLISSNFLFFDNLIINYVSYKPWIILFILNLKENELQFFFIESFNMNLYLFYLPEIKLDIQIKGE